MSWLYDSRSECFSVQTTMEVGAYLDLVSPAHALRGALSGQRDTLKTTTAKRIRSRMVADVKRGAILPPVVIGAVVDVETFSNYPMEDIVHPDAFLTQRAIKELAIIDGMQRTAALREAYGEESSIKRHFIRV